MDTWDRRRLRIWGLIAMLVAVPAVWSVLAAGAAFTLVEGPLAGVSVALRRGLLWSPVGAVGLLGLAMVMAAGAPRPTLEPGLMGRVARYPGLTVLACLGGLLVVGAFSAMSLCGCTTRAKAYQAAMKSDLKNLASVQELHRADHGAYGGDLDALEFDPSSGVEVRLYAWPDRWTARATHVALPEASCVMHVGSVSTPPSTLGGQGSPTGEVLCEEVAVPAHLVTGPITGHLADHYRRLKPKGY